MFLNGNQIQALDFAKKQLKNKIKDISNKRVEQGWASAEEKAEGESEAECGA